MDPFPVIFGSLVLAAIVWAVLGAIGLPVAAIAPIAVVAFLGIGWAMLRYN
jgi:hypothetical protein